MPRCTAPPLIGGVEALREQPLCSPCGSRDVGRAGRAALCSARRAPAPSFGCSTAPAVLEKEKANPLRLIWKLQEAVLNTVPRARAAVAVMSPCKAF